MRTFPKAAAHSREVRPFFTSPMSAPRRRSRSTICGCPCSVEVAASTSGGKFSLPLRAGGGSGIEKELRHGDVPVHRRQTQRRHLAVRARPLPRVRTGIEEHPDNVHVPGMHGEVQRGTPVSTEAVHLDTITQQPRHRSDVPVPCGEREPIRHVHSRPSPTEDGSVLPSTGIQPDHDSGW